MFQHMKIYLLPFIIYIFDTFFWRLHLSFVSAVRIFVEMNWFGF